MAREIEMEKMRRFENQRANLSAKIKKGEIKTKTNGDGEKVDDKKDDAKKGVKANVEGDGKKGEVSLPNHMQRLKPKSLNGSKTPVSVISLYHYHIESEKKEKGVEIPQTD